MRYLFTAAAAICAASSASATVSIPIVPVGHSATVTFHGIGRVSSVLVENPAVSSAIFENILGKSVRIKASFNIVRFEETDIPFGDQTPEAILITRTDNGLSWGDFGRADGWLAAEGFGIENAPSWWGYAAGASYNLASDSGWFGLRLFELDDDSFSGMSWSEAEGNWTITKVTVSVPEPVTWAMFVAGFGLIGAAVRRQKPLASFS